MVFCCIAIVGIAIIYFICLWIRQVLSWPKRDSAGSPLPAPPRALTGHGAMPVYGHTALFADRAGDAALMFEPTERSIRFLPWSRELGDCFAMFFWGQWRVVVKGTDRAQFVLSSQELKESWPWTPPVTLLGKTCYDFLEEEEIEQLRRLLGRPLSHRQVLLYASQFAVQAEKCIVDICAGKFKKNADSEERRECDNSNHRRAPSLDDSLHGTFGGYNTEEDETILGSPGISEFKIKWEAFRSYSFDLVDGPILGLNLWNSPAQESSQEHDPQHPHHQQQQHQQASRDKQNNKTDQSITETKEDERPWWKKLMSDEFDGEEELPGRETMLLYMERMKRGVDVIKTTFGPEWMYIWILNEYGRALNARMHVEKVIRKHVKQVAKRDPGVRHQLGHAYQDPTTQPIPLLTMRGNQLRNREGIFGDSTVTPQFAAGRPRSRSMPGVSSAFLESGGSSDDEFMYDSSDDYVRTFTMEQDLARPRTRAQKAVSPSLPAPPPGLEDLQRAKLMLMSPVVPGPKASTRPKPSASSISNRLKNKEREQQQQSTASAANNTNTIKMDLAPPQREWRKSMQDQLAKVEAPTDFLTNKQQVAASPAPTNPEKPRLHSKHVSVEGKPETTKLTVLERLMKQHDIAGNGLSQVVTTDISILLWMMLEVGNAWTAMALTLISTDAEALALVQQELDDLEQSYGKAGLFSPSALSRMKYMDALLFEAIRLCPANIGGMKKTTTTIEIKEAGVQIPKDTNIFFCNTTDTTFNIHRACGKKPENLGRLYPSVELHGFLPLQGMEVPLMVLQSKVFLICMLQKFTPIVSKKKTFIRRVRTQVKELGKSIRELPPSLSKSIRNVPVAVADTFQRPSSVRRATSEGEPPKNFHNRSYSSPNLPTIGSGAPENTKSYSRQGSRTFVSPNGGLAFGGDEESCELPPQPDFRAHFTKTPFPEPRRVIKIRPRYMDFQSESLSI